jgi:Uma2 family endonuclease
MTDPYEEFVDGESLLRFPPGEWHEEIVTRLHTLVGSVLSPNSSVVLLERRSAVALTGGHRVCPDLTLITTANQRPLLLVEVVSGDDHRSDTVFKKGIYEAIKIPRLWMVDPRYNNVEVYHGTAHGLSLKGILAGRETLTEALLPGLQITMNDLFRRTDS